MKRNARTSAMLIREREDRTWLWLDDYRRIGPERFARPAVKPEIENAARIEIVQFPTNIRDSRPIDSGIRFWERLKLEVYLSWPAPKLQVVRIREESRLDGINVSTAAFEIVTGISKLPTARNVVLLELKFPRLDYSRLSTIGEKNRDTTESGNAEGNEELMHPKVIAKA